MNQDLEKELRSAFEFRASDVGEDSISRVRDREYAPARRHSFTRVAIGASGVSALAVGLGVTIATFVSGTPAAYANWSPTPTVASVGQIAAAESACLTALGADIAQANAAQGSAPYIADVTAWHSTIADVQGPYVLMGFTAHQDGVWNSASCLTPTATSWSRGPEIFMSAGAGVATGPASGESAAFGGPLESGHLTNTAVKSGAGLGDSSVPANSDMIAAPSIDAMRTEVTFVIGDAGSAVSALAFSLSDGTIVDATVRNGYYAAWWPSGSVIASAQVTSPSGTASVTFPLGAQSSGDGSTSGASNTVIQSSQS